MKTQPRLACSARIAFITHVIEKHVAQIDVFASGVQAAEDDGRGLVDTVMDLLGIDPSAIGENDNLAGMGIDSMQACSHLCCCIM